MPQPQIMFGSFTSSGAAEFIPLQLGIKKFSIFNFTNAASTDNPGVVKRAWWQEGMADGAYVGVANTDGAATDETVVGTSGGFTVINDALDNQLGAPLVGTAITAATPAVATDAGHPYVVGDIVRVTNTTGMLQIAGMDFEITAVNGNDFTFGYLPAAGFAAPATALTTRLLRYDNPFTPRSRYITAITAAAQAVITFSVTHGYSVGDSIRISCPAAFGMVEIDGLVGEIVAVNTTTNTVTVDIDSSGFTAFAFPASASVPFSFAQAQFAGENSLLNSNPYENQLRRGVLLGTNVVGAASDVVYWQAEFGY